MSRKEHRELDKKYKIVVQEIRNNHDNIVSQMDIDDILKKVGEEVVSRVSCEENDGDTAIMENPLKFLRAKNGKVSI